MPAILFGFIPVITRLARRISPTSGRLKPQITLSSVVLPAPLGPMMPTISPARNVAETRSRARTPPNEIETPSTARVVMSSPPPDCHLRLYLRQHQVWKLPGGAPQDASVLPNPVASAS